MIVDKSLEATIVLLHQALTLGVGRGDLRPSAQRQIVLVGLSAASPGRPEGAALAECRPGKREVNFL